MHSWPTLVSSDSKHGELIQNNSTDLMHRYNWIKPHQFNDGLPSAVAEERLNPLSGMG